jgi:hypothetical protein
MKPPLSTAHLIAASRSLGVPLLGLQRAQNTADLRSP